MDTAIESPKDEPSAPAGCRDVVSCAGQAVTIEWFEPPNKDADATAAIILLHDVGGCGPDRPIRAEADALARAGYRVALPHYLAACGTEQVGLSDIARTFGRWHDLVADVRDHVRDRLRCGHRTVPLALAGRSLGGALALGAVDAGIAALVLRSAVLPPSLVARASLVAPTLILHGSRDVMAPASAAHALAESIRAAGQPCDFVPFPDQAHGFDAGAEHAATARMLAFLSARLAGPN